MGISGDKRKGHKSSGEKERKGKERKGKEAANAKEMTQKQYNSRRCLTEGERKAKDTKREVRRLDVTCRRTEYRLFLFFIFQPILNHPRAL